MYTQKQTMKYLFTSLALLAVLAVNAQENLGITQNTSEALAAGSTALSSHGASSYFYNQAREVDGKVHLFEDWENSAVIHTNDNQRLMVRNINLNLKRNAFEAKISKDSLFSFNFNNIEKFVVNNKIYKNYYWDNDNKVYEVIFENGDFQLLKGFKVVYIEGSANPMLNRARDKYIRREFFYLRQNEEIKPFRLKKNKILRLLDSDQVNSDKVAMYAKDNKLSFKRPYDVQKILENFVIN